MRLSTLQLTLLTSKIDPVSACALALLLAALGLHWTLTERAAAQRDQAKEELFVLASATPSTSEDRSDTTGSLAHFRSVQVDRNSLPDIIEQTFSIAREHRLELGQGEYRMDSSPIGGFSHYRITLPIIGRYSALRPFVESVLAEWPGISLEQVSFSRGHAGEPETEAVVRFALLVRD